MEHIFQASCNIIPEVSCSPQYFRPFQPGEAQLIVFQPVTTRLWGVFFSSLSIFDCYFPPQTSRTCHGKLSSALEHRSWKVSLKIIKTRSILLSRIPIPGFYVHQEGRAGQIGAQGRAALCRGCAPAWARPRPAGMGRGVGRAAPGHNTGGRGGRGPPEPAVPASTHLSSPVPA